MSRNSTENLWCCTQTPAASCAASQPAANRMLLDVAGLFSEAAELSGDELVTQVSTTLLHSVETLQSGRGLACGETDRAVHIK